MKLYEVIFQDEYNNLYQLGYYKSLSDSINDINSELDSYGVAINADDLVEYPSTFNMCFDACIGDLVDEKILDEHEEVSSLYIRGFILDSDSLLEVINNGN